MEEELTELPHGGSLLDEGCHRRGRQLGHLRGGALGGHDQRVTHQLVAIAMVAVGVGVHERVDPPGGGDGAAHLGEHALREGEVEKRVDEQRRLAVDDETGVAPTPATVGLKVGVETIAHFVQTHAVARAHTRPLCTGYRRGRGRGRRSAQPFAITNDSRRSAERPDALSAVTATV